MIFEIVGSRVVAPFIGTSTYIWTSLIGVILASLSLGYWLGGRIADRRPDVKVLAAAVLAAAGCISFTALVKDIVLAALAGAPILLEIKALLASLLLFAPASVCLGFVTPFAARLELSAVANTGRTVGGLYALSTLGSILGTFAAGFFLIPFVGSNRTLYSLAAVLLVAALALAPLASTRMSASVMALFAVSTLGSEASGWLQTAAGRFVDLDTEYSRIQGFRTLHGPEQRGILAIATDPYFTQSAIYEDGDELVLEYPPFYHLIRHFKPGFEGTLMIGGGGYSFPREYLRVYPGARIDVVEIDPQMTALARRYFRLKDDPRMTIIHEDARMLLNRSETGKYDVVLMDAFGSLFTVPYHLTTREAVAEMSRVLKHDGVVIFNVGSAITGPGSRFLQAELRTYREIFPQVLIFKVRPALPDDRLQNVILVASKSDRAFDLRSDDPFLSALLSHLYQGTVALDEPALTDDLAPVEYYNSVAQRVYLSARTAGLP